MRTQTPQNRVQFARALRKVFLGVFAVSAIFAFMVVLTPGVTQAATASTVNFQARLETNSGAIVPDGTYNVEFKLYNAASGGSAEWTEDYTYNSGPGATDARIRVANGYLTVNLGSLCPFTAGTCQGYTETSIDWTQQQWLTMNIGGTGSTGTYPTMGDGEMNPRLALTAVPYAFEAGTLGATSGTNVATLSFSTPTSSEQLLLPAASGTQYVCYQGASGCGFLTGSGAGVQLQAGTPPGTPQHGNFNIDGTGIAGVLQAGSLDTASAAGLGIGASNATAITLGNATSNILTTINGTVLVKPTSGHDSTTAFQVQNAGGTSVLNVDTTNNRVGINTAVPGAALEIDYALSGSPANTPGLVIKNTYAGGVGSQAEIQLLAYNNGSGGTAWTLSANDDNDTFRIFDGNNARAAIDNNGNFIVGASLQGNTSVLTPLLDTASAAALGIGASNATAITLGNATSNILTTINGTVLVKPTSGHDSTTAFQVQKAGGSTLLTVDTSNTAIVLGNDGTPNAVTVRGGAASGSNLAGANLTFDASNGTGSGGSGDLIFRTAAPAANPITLDATSNSANSAATLSWSHTTAASNEILVVGIGTTSSTNSVSSVSYNGVALTKLTSQTCPAGNTCDEELWYELNPATGSHTITVTLGASAEVFGGAATYANVNQTTPFGTAATNSGSSNPSSLTVASNSTQLIIDGIMDWSNGSLGGVQSGQTQLWQPNLFGFNSGGSSKPAGTSSTSLGWTVAAGSSWAEVAAPLNPIANTTPNTLTDRLHITASGNVGIDNANPQYTLDVTGTGQFSTTVLSPRVDTPSTGTLTIGNTNATAINLGNTTSNILTTINGTVLVKPTSGHDSTTAFQVQSAGGPSVLDADTVHGYVGVGTGTPNYNLDVSGKNAAFNSSKDGSTGSFTSATALPVTLRSAETATANGYMYVLGGNNGSAGVTTVYYDSLNADGTLGTTWNTTTVLPQALYAGQAIVANGYIYYIGGWDDSTGNWSAAVYYAKLNSDGTIGAWVTATSSLPDGDFSFTSVEANGYLYVIGGKVASSASSTNKVYYAKLNSDGSLGSWTTASNTIPQHLQDHISVVANGYVYVIGGWDSFNLVYTTSSYYAKLNSDGSVGTWNTTTNVPGGQLIKMRGAVANGYVYLLGGTTDSSGTGYTSALSTIYYARLNSDGTLGAWTTNSQSLPNPVFLEGAAEANGYIYTLAGDNNTNTLQTAVYYGSTARLQIAGSLDLIGLTGQNLAADSGDLGSAGSVGGSIYAGNIFANGSLSVTSNAQFWNGLNSAGSLSVTGTATVQTTSTTAFQVQAAGGTSVLTIDTTNLVVTVAGTSSSFGLLTLTNAHFSSTQTTAPTIGTPTSCATSPSASITAGSTDSAGSFTITSGTGTQTSTCQAVITFNAAYGLTPKTAILTAASAAAAKEGAAVTGTSTTTFTVVLPNTTTASTAYRFYYWIVQ